MQHFWKETKPWLHINVEQVWVENICFDLKFGVFSFVYLNTWSKAWYLLLDVEYLIDLLLLARVLFRQRCFCIMCHRCNISGAYSVEIMWRWVGVIFPPIWPLTTCGILLKGAFPGPQSCPKLPHCQLIECAMKLTRFVTWKFQNIAPV